MADAQAKLIQAQYSDLPKGAASVSPEEDHQFQDTPKGSVSLAKSAALPPQQAPIPKNYGFTLGNMYTNAMRGVGELGTGLYNVGNDLLNNPDWITEKNGKLPTGAPGETSMLSKFVVQPAAIEQQKARTAKTPAESIGHSVAEAIPVIGPWASSLGEQAGTGDIGGALARGGTQAGAMKAVELAPKAVKGAAGAGIRAVGKSIADATPKSEPLGLTFRDMRDPQAMQDYAAAQRAGEVPADVHAANMAKFDNFVAKQPPIEIRPASAKDMIARMPQRGGTPKTPEQLGLKPASVSPPVENDMMVEQPKPTNLGTSVTPQEVNSVEYVGGSKTGDMMQMDKPKSSSEQVNALASQEVRKLEGEKPEMSAKQRGQLSHTIGDYAADQLTDSVEGVEAAHRLRQGTYQQYADLANYEGVRKPQAMVSKSGKEWTGSDFARSVASHGKELNPSKEMVIRYLVDNYGADEIKERTDGWGKK